jgi:hypothetical protein
VTEPTTILQGELNCVCANDLNNDHIKNHYLPAISTDNGYTVVDYCAPNCTESGIVVYLYTFDGQEFTFSDIEIATGHLFGDWIKEVPAKCESNGTKGHFFCEWCKKNFDENQNEIQDITILALGHDYGKWYVDTAPTIINPGVLKRRCANDSANDHAYPIRQRRDQHAKPTDYERNDKSDIARSDQRDIIEQFFCTVSLECHIRADKLTDEHNSNEYVTDPKGRGIFLLSCPADRYKCDYVKECKKHCPSDYV